MFIDLESFLGQLSYTIMAQLIDLVYIRFVLTYRTVQSYTLTKSLVHGSRRQKY